MHWTTLCWYPVSSLVADRMVGQFKPGVKTRQEMCPFREKNLCLCKTWILAYSHTTHSAANYTFARDIYRAEHTAAVYSVSSSNLNYVEKDIAWLFNLLATCSSLWIVRFQLWLTKPSKAAWILLKKKKERKCNRNIIFRTSDLQLFSSFQCDNVQLGRVGINTSVLPVFAFIWKVSLGS